MAIKRTRIVSHGKSKERKAIEILQGRAEHYLPMLPRVSLWAHYTDGSTNK